MSEVTKTGPLEGIVGRILDCTERCRRLHPHCTLILTRSVAPDKFWHWAVTMPDGHCYAISAGAMTFEDALDDMQSRGVAALGAADALWRAT